jgi:L-rhamnose mutarotase
MERIWQNQNPPDCRKAKYLIVEGWYQGFGSEFHIYGAALAAGIETNRVVLQQGGWTWRFKNKFCRDQQKNSLECYFLPWSKCTILDAMQAMYPEEYSRHLQIERQGLNTDWNDEDDHELYQLIRKYTSLSKWNLISKEITKKNRTSHQCYRRWKEVLLPRYKPLGDSRKVQPEIILSSFISNLNSILIGYVIT